MPFSVIGNLPGYSKRDFKTVVRKMIAADPEDDVVLLIHGYALWEVRVNHGATSRWQATFWFDRESRRVIIGWFHRPDDGEPGWGRKKFLVLASRWQADGYKTAHASPADGPPNKGMTGYYFWPTVGFDAPLTKEHYKALPKEFQKKRGYYTVRSLFESPRGREAWRQYGSIIYGMTLDLETL